MYDSALVNIHDYLIDPSGKNWTKLLRWWMPPLPPKFSVWLINRLGDAFVVLANDAVLRLDVGAGAVAEVASNREHFAKLLDRPDNAREWLRMELVDGCRQAGLELRPHECYGFKLPPTLGGRYEVANLKPTDLAVHYSYQAYICKQEDVYWVPPD